MSGAVAVQEAALPRGVARAEAPPRVLFCTHSSRLGGAEHILLSLLGDYDARSSLFLFEDGPLVARLAGQAVRPVVAARASGFTAVKRDGALLRRALPLLGGMARMGVELARAARRHDLVYANSQKAFVLAAMAAPLARRKLIWHLHDILTEAHFGRAQLRLLRLLAGRAARIIVPSRAAAAALIAEGGDAARLRVVPNGVTLPRDGSEDMDRAALRARLGLPDGFLIGVFSRLSPWKGQHVVLRALARSPARAIILGDALFGEDDYAAALRREARALGLGERVRFLGHRDDVPALMRAVDAVVHPSIDPEPFGRTLVEAMLCRTPVIATALGAAPEILGEEAGWLVPPEDPEALAAAIGAVRVAPEAATARVAAGARRAEALFGERRMRDGVAAVIREVA